MYQTDRQTDGQRDMDIYIDRYRYRYIDITS